MIKIDQQLSEAFNLAGLTDVQRQVVAMYLEGASCDKMSKKREATESAVKKVIAAAKQKYVKAFNTRSLIKGSIENGVHLHVSIGVLKKINNLSQGQQEALKLVAKGYDVKNIAYTLSVAEGTVKQRLRQAKKNLCDSSTSKQGVAIAFTAVHALIHKSASNHAMKVSFFDPKQALS